MKTTVKKWLAGLTATLLLGVVASTLTDIENDIQSQKVISLYGNDFIAGEWQTLYNDGILTIPDEMVCLLRQLWKPELLNQGNVRVQVNEKLCLGNADGKASIEAVANLSQDASGNVNGKFWYNDLGSITYPGNPDVVVYLKVSVTASPTTAEPLGRFTIDATDQDKNTNEILGVFRIESLGTQFNVSGKIPANSTYFAGYADFSARKAVYKLSSTLSGFDAAPAVRIGFNDTLMCFQSEDNAADCFARDVNAAGVMLNAWSYGIYNADGSRYTGAVDYLMVDGCKYSLTGGFGGNLSVSETNAPCVAGNGPGNESRATRDAVFWSDQSATMGSANTPVRLAWLTKTHSVPRATRSNLPGDSSIQLDANPGNLVNPASLDDARARSIGSLPDVSGQSVRVKSGKLQ